MVNCFSAALHPLRYILDSFPFVIYTSSFIACTPSKAKLITTKKHQRRESEEREGKIMNMHLKWWGMLVDVAAELGQ
jgi:hypothetical protein